MSEICSKCQEENPDTLRFCRRCHTPLIYICPACKSSQRHGGTCDSCGVDFMKYSMIQMDRLVTAAERDRSRAERHTSLIKEVVLAILTGGFSLLRLLRRQAK